MKPILFEWGPVVIPSFGFFLALGFLIGSFVLWRRLKEDYPEDDLLTLSLVLGLWGLLGARIISGAFNFTRFGWDLWKWLSLGRIPGLSFYGAIVGVVVGTILFTRRFRWRLGDVWDGVVEGSLWLWVLTSIGAFLSSVLPGKATNLPWATNFLGLSDKRHPVSLYYLIASFIILCLIWWLRSSYRKFRWYLSGKVGFVGLLGAFMIGVTIFILESFTERGIYFYSIKLEQIFALCVIITTLVLIYSQSGRKFLEDQKSFGRFIRSRSVLLKQRSRTNKK